MEHASCRCVTECSLYTGKYSWTKEGRGETETSATAAAAGTAGQAGTTG